MALGWRPTMWSSSFARSSVSFSLCPPRTRMGSVTIWPMVMRGEREEYGSWKTIWMRRRSGRSSSSFMWEMSVPPKRMRPEVGSSRRTMRFARVDLPQPDSPTMPMDSPFSMERDTPFKACTSFVFPKNPFVRKVFVTLSIVSSALMRPPPFRGSRRWPARCSASCGSTPDGPRRSGCPTAARCGRFPWRRGSAARSGTLP